MPISHVGSAINNVSGGSSVSVTLPGGVQQDDAVYVAVASSRTVDQDIVEGSGTYTELADLFRIDSLATQLGVFRKIQGATPDSSVSITIAGNSNFAIAAKVLRGVDTTTPEDAATTSATGTNGTVVDPAAITTATDGARVIAIGAASEAVAVTTAPTDYGNLVTTLDTNIVVAMADREIATAGVEDPGTYAEITGQGTDSWASATVAVRPAAGGGGTTVSVTGHAVPVVIGTPTADTTVTVPVTGHEVAVAIGSPTADTTVTIAVAGLEVPVAFGTPTAVQDNVPQTVAVTGLDVPVLFGTVTVILDQTVAVAGLEVPIAFGTVTPLPDQIVAVTGLAVPIVFGAPSAVGDQVVAVDGVEVAISFGTVTARVGGWTAAATNDATWTPAAAAGGTWA